MSNLEQAFDEKQRLIKLLEQEIEYLKENKGLINCFIVLTQKPGTELATEEATFNYGGGRYNALGLLESMSHNIKTDIMNEGIKNV